MERRLAAKMGAHLVTMETTDKWNKISLAEKVTETGSCIYYHKVERGNGPRQDRLMGLWPQVIAAGTHEPSDHSREVCRGIFRVLRAV